VATGGRSASLLTVFLPTCSPPLSRNTAKVTAINAPRMAPSVPFRALLSVITTSNNPELSGQRLRRIEVPTLDGPQAELRQPCGGSPKRRPAPGTAGGAHAPIRCRWQRNAQGRSATMGQARQKSPAVLIVEDDAEVRSLAATLRRRTPGHYRMRECGSCACDH